MSKVKLSKGDKHFNKVLDGFFLEKNQNEKGLKKIKANLEDILKYEDVSDPYKLLHDKMKQKLSAKGLSDSKLCQNVVSRLNVNNIDWKGYEDYRLNLAVKQIKADKVADILLENGVYVREYENEKLGYAYKGDDLGAGVLGGEWKKLDKDSKTITHILEDYLPFEKTYEEYYGFMSKFFDAIGRGKVKSTQVAPANDEVAKKPVSILDDYLLGFNALADYYENEVSGNLLSKKFDEIIYDYENPDNPQAGKEYASTEKRSKHRDNKHSRKCLKDSGDISPEAIKGQRSKAGRKGIE